MTACFKIKLIKKDLIMWPDKDGSKPKLGQGLYQQLKGGNIVTYDTTKTFSLQLFKDTMKDLFDKPTVRQTKVNPLNQAAVDLINKAIEAEAKKQKKNEYRKRFSLQSEVFKQTYKFGQ